jgi:tRNA dimethylallyltransferase
MTNKIIAVVGPTASGKTALSIEIAKRVSGEVVSCDSMQIYRGMDIGTAKPDEDEKCGIPHHLIDIADPSQRFSVAEFVAKARECIDDCLKRGKTPVLAGGTGLYMDSILNNIEFAEFQEDPNFRTQMQRYADKNGNKALHQLLCKKDPCAAERIHPNNVRRVIRALEICKTSGKTFTQVNAESRREPVYDALVLGIETDREALYKKIDLRVDIMMQKGLLEEVRRLYKKGIGKDTTAMQAIGYKELVEFLEGKTELLDAVDKIKQESRRYAKRQMTWFRRNEAIEWIKPDSKNALEDVLQKCYDFLGKK